MPDLAQSTGGATHSSCAKNMGAVTMMQPIWKLPVVVSPSPRNRAIRSTIDSKVGAPFISPKHSHASQAGRDSYRSKKPNPAILLYGARSLKKNGSPGAIARNDRPPCGCQKLTSSTRERAAKNEYQSGSVRPMYPFCASTRCPLLQTVANWRRHFWTTISPSTPRHASRCTRAAHRGCSHLLARTRCGHRRGGWRVRPVVA